QLVRGRRGRHRAVLQRCDRDFACLARARVHLELYRRRQQPVPPAGSYQNTNPPILLARCATDPHGNPYPSPLPLCRGMPDLSAQSGDIPTNGYQITVGGKKDQAGGGTSLSSPLWLGMWTRIQAAGSKKGNGFANYALYAAAQRTPSTFFDVGGLSTETAPNCNGQY